MKLRHLMLFIAISSMLVFSYSCSKDKDVTPADSGKSLPEINIEDLPADPNTRSVNDGHLIGGTDQFTFFRFRDSTIILSSRSDNRSDSATTKWDIAFRGTDIILNSGISGPGHVEGQIVDNTFEGVSEAPKEGYKQDKKTGSVFTSWYHYNDKTHIITPKPGYIFIIHTQDGDYVKMEILNYYKGHPKAADLDFETDDQRYYTFRYVIQTDGSRSFLEKK